MKYFSTFTGIGGFEKGIEQAYDNRKLLSEQIAQDIQKDKSDTSLGQNRPTCVGYSEIDKYAIQIYEKHFKHKNYGDITKINAADLPDFDLYVGGFPCQAFSIAGKRRGFDDTRGTLFFDVARILKEKRPRNFILENVKGLLSHDNGNTFKTIIATLAELGYCVEWQVLNSKNFGVPQNRERVFIIGHLGGIPERKVFPVRENSQLDIILPTLTTRYYGGQANGGYIGNKQKQVLAWSKSVGMDNGKMRNEQRVKTNGEFNTLSTGEGGSNYSSKNFIVEDIKIRRLTPTECERLQGYPDGWTEGVSDSQRYKCLGNAVTVNVIEHIIKLLIS